MVHRIITGQPRNKNRKVLSWYPLAAHQDFFPLNTGRIKMYFNVLLLSMQQGLRVHVNDLHFLSTCMQKMVTTVRSVFPPITRQDSLFFGVCSIVHIPGNSSFSSSHLHAEVLPSLVSISTSGFLIWVPRFTVRSSGLCSQGLYLLDHLSRSK